MRIEEVVLWALSVEKDLGAPINPAEYFIPLISMRIMVINTVNEDIRCYHEE